VYKALGNEVKNMYTENVLPVAFKFFFSRFPPPNLGQLWPEFEKYFGGKKYLNATDNK
jgi:hypothetical protein